MPLRTATLVLTTLALVAAHACGSSTSPRSEAADNEVDRSIYDDPDLFHRRGHRTKATTSAQVGPLHFDDLQWPDEETGVGSVRVQNQASERVSFEWDAGTWGVRPAGIPAEAPPPLNFVDEGNLTLQANESARLYISVPPDVKRSALHFGVTLRGWTDAPKPSFGSGYHDHNFKLTE